MATQPKRKATKPSLFKKLSTFIVKLARLTVSVILGPMFLFKLDHFDPESVYFKTPGPVFVVLNGKKVELDTVYKLKRLGSEPSAFAHFYPNIVEVDMDGNYWSWVYLSTSYWSKQPIQANSDRVELTGNIYDLDYLLENATDQPDIIMTDIKPYSDDLPEMLR